MKQTSKFILGIFLIALTISDANTAPKKRGAKRAAASSNKTAKSSSSSGSKKSGKKSGGKSSSKKGKSDKSESSKGSDDTPTTSKGKLSGEDKCLADNINSLLEGDCKFLNEEDVLKELTSEFFCIYNYKDKTKINSVQNYYLYQKYGIKDINLKDGEATIKIKDKPKGASKYYEYLLKGLTDKTLNDGRILDFLTEEIIDSDTSLTKDEISAIEKITIESTTIPMETTKSAVEKCTKSAKAILLKCNAMGSASANEKIETSCTEYDSALTTQTAKIKGELLDKRSQLSTILRQRYFDSLTNAADIAAAKATADAKVNAAENLAAAKVETINAEAEIKINKAKSETESIKGKQSPADTDNNTNTKDTEITENKEIANDTPESQKTEKEEEVVKTTEEKEEKKDNKEDNSKEEVKEQKEPTDSTKESDNK